MREALVITGGAGFIGCAISQRLSSFGLPVVAVDNLHPQVHRERKRPEALDPTVELIVGDVTERATWDVLLDKWSPVAVVHLAAETGTGQSLTEATRHARVNVDGTTVMLDSFVQRGVIPRHIVLTSSRAVYGEGAWCSSEGTVFYPEQRSHEALARALWDPRDAVGNIATPRPQSAQSVHPAPTSVYGATKLCQEHVLSAWCNAMNTRLSIFRLQNVYGPGQSPFNAYTGIITLFHRLARKQQALEIYEDGRIGRDFVFIDDVADALVAGLATPPTRRRVLDVGTGQVTTIEDAARYVARLHGAPEPVVVGKFRDGDVRWAVCDAEPLARELNVRAKVGFEEGCKRVGEWLVARGYA